VVEKIFEGAFSGFRPKDIAPRQLDQLKRRREAKTRGGSKLAA
jgi:hypothetical protein